MWVSITSRGFEAEPDTSVAFEAGIDHLQYMEVGDTFFVQCEVTHKGEASMVLKPISIAPTQSER